MAEENNNKEIIQAPTGAKLDEKSVEIYKAQTKAANEAAKEAIKEQEKFRNELQKTAQAFTDNQESTKNNTKAQKDFAESTKDSTEKLADFSLVQDALGKNLTNILFFTERIQSVSQTFTRSTKAIGVRLKDTGNSLGSFYKNIFVDTDRVATTFGENVGKKLPKGLRGATTSTFRLAGAFFSLSTAIIATGIGAVLIALTAFIAIGAKFVKNFLAIDKAASDVAKSTGILSQNLSSVITGAAQFERLGGNLELVSEAFDALASNFSVAIKFTGELVGNTAVVAQEFGLGAENAAKLIEIISATQDLTLNQAAKAAEGFVRDLGAIGPAIVKNLAEGYDEVVSSFGLAEESLAKQAELATKLGLELSRTADISKQLLDFQTSIPAEFELSVRLGRQLNFNAARRLAIQGKTAEATQEVIRQLGEGRDLTKLSFFDAQAIQQATGLTVAELIRQKKIQEQIASGERVSEQVRASALSNVERITNRIKGIFFKIFSSEEVTEAITKLGDSIQKLIDSSEFQKTVQKFADYIGNIADYIASAKNLEQLKNRLGEMLGEVIYDAFVFATTKGISGIIGGFSQGVGQVNRNVRAYAGDKALKTITGGKYGREDALKLDAKLYRGLYETQENFLDLFRKDSPSTKISTSPSQTTREQSQQNEMLSSVKSNTDAINNLAEKGIIANAYLDSDKVSSGLARSNRYG